MTLTYGVYAPVNGIVSREITNPKALTNHADELPMNRPKMIVGISGASGSCYGLAALRALRLLGVESHLIISRAAEVTLAHETGKTVADVAALADYHYAPDNIGAGPASGSFRTLGMIIAPCSIRSMGEIATGVTSSLLTRAADVTLKERRRLVLMVRETPLHTGHLRNMLQLSEMGAIVAPPVPAFYAQPKTLDEMVEQTVGRMLDLFGLDAGITRWGE